MLLFCAKRLVIMEEDILFWMGICSIPLIGALVFHLRKLMKWWKEKYPSRHEQKESLISILCAFLSFFVVGTPYYSGLALIMFNIDDWTGNKKCEGVCEDFTMVVGAFLFFILPVYLTGIIYPMLRKKFKKAL